MGNNFFTICSFFYSSLLAIVFFYKKRLKSLENKLYSSLVISNLVNVVFAIFSYITIVYKDTSPLLNDIVSKTLMVCFYAWLAIYTVYVLIISYKKTTYDDVKAFMKKIMIIFFTVSVIVVVLIYAMPFYYHNEGGIVYSYGPSANVVYIMSAILVMVWIVAMTLNYKNIKNKKYLPIFTYIILIVPILIIQKLFPGLLLLTATGTFVTFLMYFTIENPDMKLIRELNFAKEQAEKANNAKTDFLSSMSHEVRTPLNAIVGFSQTLKDDENISHTAKEEISDIVSACDSLLDIVNGILDISKIEANKLEIIKTEYSFRKVFNDLCSLTRARLGDKPLELRFIYDESVPEILYGDHHRLKQIALNLLTNSIKYTKEGFIEFKVSSVLVSDVCRLIISVEDSGIGIKEENINKLFTKFERFDERNTTTEGTGLGLAITKKLVDLMHGKIVVQSKYGSGSKFTVSIEQGVVTGEKAEELIQKTQEIQMFNATGKKILIVDDNELNLKVAQRMLEKYNVIVDVCDSGFACIDKINNNEKYDLILLDDMMPKMTGVETLKQLKNNLTFTIPTIALTANAIAGMREKYLSEGFDDYVPKPIEKAELNRIMLKYLNK